MGDTDPFPGWRRALCLVVLLFSPSAAFAQGISMEQMQMESNTFHGNDFTQGSVPRYPEDRPPRPIYRAVPRYPLAYAQRGVQGTVLVDFIVNRDGTVARATAIESPDPRLSQAAEAAVTQWIFQPEIRRGEPVISHLQIPILFRPPADSDDPQARAIAAQAKGDADAAGGDFLMAIISYDKALSLVPGDPEVIYRRGLARERMAEYRPARADFRDAIRLDPDDSRFHLALGEVDSSSGDWADAAAEFDLVVRLAPDAAAGYSGRGAAFAAQGRDDEALDDFRAALSIDPGDKAALGGQSGIMRKRAKMDPKLRDWTELRYRTFQVVWSTVNQEYFDPSFGGVNWKAIREKYRLLLPRAANNDQLRGLLEAMLSELKKTHFGIVPREGAVFNPAERVRIGTAGVEMAIVGGLPVVAEVRRGSAGAAAGLKAGDRVEAVDDIVIARTLASLQKAGVPPARRGLYITEFVQSRLEGPVGSKVRLALLAPGGARRAAVVTCRTNDAAWSEPVGRTPSLPIRWEAVRDAGGIGYLRFNAFVLPVIATSRKFLASLGPRDGLIVDLRGNSGGVLLVACGLSGWLSGRELVLGITSTRDGVQKLDVYPQAGAFTGPLAVLIDGRSASTSEVMAAGLREAGRARIFGEPSAGAAMPSSFKTLPTGDLFQYAIGDVTTPGARAIEGKGVNPDVVVTPAPAELAAGRDPALEAARVWLSHERGTR